MYTLYSKYWYSANSTMSPTPINTMTVQSPVPVWWSIALQCCCSVYFPAPQSFQSGESLFPALCCLAVRLNKTLSRCDIVCFLALSSFPFSFHWLAGSLQLVCSACLPILPKSSRATFLVELCAVTLWQCHFPVHSKPRSLFSGLSNMLSLLDICCFPSHQVVVLEVVLDS